MPVKKANKSSRLLTILSIILLILFVLKFDAVTSAIDPNNKLNLGGFASDAFPIVLGAILITIGLAAAASPWVAVAMIAVGVGMIASKGYSIYKRKAAPTVATE